MLGSASITQTFMGGLEEQSVSGTQTYKKQGSCEMPGVTLKQREKKRRKKEKIRGGGGGGGRECGGGQ